MRKLVLISFALIQLSVTGQLIPDNADYFDSVVTANKADKYYFSVFNINKNTPQDAGSITYHPDIDINYNLSIYRFDTTTAQFTPFRTSSTNDTAFIGNLTEGGYLLVADTNTVFDSIVVWIYMNEFSNQSISLKQIRNDCGLFTLQAGVQLDTFYYYDFTVQSQESIPYYYSYTYKDMTNNGDEIEGGSDNETDLLDATLNLYPADFPEDDIDISIRLTDRFGAAIIHPDTFFYETRFVEAEITEVVWDTLYWDENPNYPLYPDEDPKSAPYTVRFDPSGTKNATEYRWNFDDYRKTSDSVYYNDTIVEHTFYPIHPDSTEKDRYWVKLYATNKFNCISVDSTDIEITDTENQPQGAKNLQFPKLLMLQEGGGEPELHYFRPSNISVREMRLRIYNRFGVLVYDYEGYGNMEEWEGWDGSMRGKGNQYVKPGVYYYVAEYKVYYDDVTHYVRDFVHVFDPR